MSDCFDHEAEAYDDLAFGRTAEGEDDSRRSYSGGGYDYQPSNDIQCRYCGAEDLHWKSISGKWRLSNEHGELHVCDNYRRVQQAKHDARKNSSKESR